VEGCDVTSSGTMITEVNTRVFSSRGGGSFLVITTPTTVPAMTSRNGMSRNGSSFRLLRRGSSSDVLSSTLGSLLISSLLLRLCDGSSPLPSPAISSSSRLSSLLSSFILDVAATPELSSLSITLPILRLGTSPTNDPSTELSGWNDNLPTSL